MRLLSVAVALVLLPGCRQPPDAASVPQAAAPPLPPELLAEMLERTVVMVSKQKPEGSQFSSVTIGSGFLVSPIGHVVTADHVVIDEDTGTPMDPIFATRFTGQKHRYMKMRLVKRFRGAAGEKGGRDIAVLQPLDPDQDVPFLRISSSPSVAGDSVMMAGFPLVFDRVLTFPFIRKGTVASVRYRDKIVLDLTAVSGFSGSPVINAHNEVVAVLVGHPKRNQGSNFAVAAPISPADISEIIRN